MSISSEINRISGNVSDSLEAVAAKGVTVPAGANSDNLPNLISQIPQGTDVMVVTITATESQGEIVYSADKTFTEIETAIENGATVIARYDHIWLNLVEATTGSITFSAVAGQSSPILYKVFIFDNDSVGYEWAWLSDINDVQVNGTSVVSQGVANVPIASQSDFGVVKIDSGYGIAINGGKLIISKASDDQIKTGTTNMKSIVPGSQDKSVFYGLAKAAGDSTQSASSNAVGTYTSEAKAAIQTMLGVPSTSDVSAKYTKPASGIPASDLASGVIPDVSGKLNAPSTAGTSGQVLSLNSSLQPVWTTPQSGSETMVVSVTASFDTQTETYVYTKNKTFAEIISAINAGGQVVVDYRNEDLDLAHSHNYYRLAFMYYNSNNPSSTSNMVSFKDEHENVINIHLDNSIEYTAGIRDTLVVHFADDIGSFFADKTLSEIYNAVQNNVSVIGKTGNYGNYEFYPLVLLDYDVNSGTGQADFLVSSAAGISTFTLYSTGVVEHSQTYWFNPDAVATKYEDLDFPIPAGTCCIYEGDFFKSTQRIGEYEDFDPDHWAYTSAGTEIGGLYQLIGEKLNAPLVAGTSGQVLSLNSSLQPVWTTPQSGSDTMVVTITATVGRYGTEYSADKTYAEIVAAIQAGKTVIAKCEWSHLGKYWFDLVNHFDDEQNTSNSVIVFSASTEDVLWEFKIDASNNVTCIENNIAADINNLYQEKVSTAVVAPEYDDLTFPVSKGQMCFNEDMLYEATQNIQTSEVWTGAHWRNIKIGDKLQESDVLFVHVNNETATLDKTWQEIHDAMQSKIAVIQDSEEENVVHGIFGAAVIDGNDYCVSTFPGQTGEYANYVANSANGYPRFEEYHCDFYIKDVQVNNTSVLDNGVANVPLASWNTYGVGKADGGNYGIGQSNGYFVISTASADNTKAGIHTYKPITPSNQHQSTFYGLAKAAGDSTQSASNNAVGTYTSEAKAAIRTMLDVASNSEIESIENSIAPQYEDLTFPVAKGKHCYHDGDLYMANTNIQTSETWDSTHWTKRTATTVLESVESNITSIASVVAAKYQKPAGGIPSSDMASAVQTSLGKADTAYQKPSGGIPASDLASGVIPDISGKIDKPSSYVTGHLAAISGTGNIADSGLALNDLKVYKFTYSIPANNGPVTMSYDAGSSTWYTEALLSDNARVVGYYATQWKYYKDIDVSFSTTSSRCTMSVGVDILPGASAGTLELYITETVPKGA